ncbi:hypothetical protein CVU37_13915 [candidate division BRC1 bacterium HGW-BRC1-1]|nr:MAG: hypothetical protein CVU37_13915 [candidate division BRC1 bacterium HGW-BRC1-1]
MLVASRVEWGGNDYVGGRGMDFMDDMDTMDTMDEMDVVLRKRKLLPLGKTLGGSAAAGGDRPPVSP